MERTERLRDWGFRGWVGLEWRRELGVFSRNMGLPLGKFPTSVFLTSLKLSHSPL